MIGCKHLSEEYILLSNQKYHEWQQLLDGRWSIQFGL